MSGGDWDVADFQSFGWCHEQSWVQRCEIPPCWWWKIITFDIPVAVQTFNFHNVPPDNPYFVPAQQQAYREIGDPDGMRFKDKMFVVQRRYYMYEKRYGEWNWYSNQNPQGQLPATVSTDGLPSPIQVLYVSDDLAACADRIKDLQLRILLSGTETKDVIEVKLNGVLLPAPTVRKDGWRIFAPTPRTFAVGRNLVSVRLPPNEPTPDKPVVIEKVEAHVSYSLPE